VTTGTGRKELLLCTVLGYNNLYEQNSFFIGSRAESWSESRLGNGTLVAKIEPFVCIVLAHVQVIRKYLPMESCPVKNTQAATASVVLVRP
jgi:hypothetical protein